MVELIAADKTDPASAATAAAWVASLGKIPLAVADSPGFVVNRLLCPMFNEACHLLAEGTTGPAIDQAARAFGFEYGPLEFIDQIGIDTLHAAARWLMPRLDRVEPSLVLHGVHRGGWRGRKSGAGFYRYDTGSPPRWNDSLDPVIAEYRTADSPLDESAIGERLLLTLVNHAADLLHRGIAAANEIDLAMIEDAGFPRHRGGPLFWGHRQGVAPITRADRATGQRRTTKTALDTDRRIAGDGAIPAGRSIDRTVRDRGGHPPGSTPYAATLAQRADDRSRVVNAAGGFERGVHDRDVGLAAKRFERCSVGDRSGRKASAPDEATEAPVPAPPAVPIRLGRRRGRHGGLRG